MESKSTITQQLFDALEGTWTGDGRGGYPTIESFDYHEMLAFTRRNEMSLAYEQRTQKRLEGRIDYIVSHWENGFIQVRDNGQLELVNAQSGGRSEVLIGDIKTSGDVFRIHFTNQTITNDPRLVSSARRFELEGDTLRYQMEMQTNKVKRSTLHLKIELHRQK